MQRDHQTTIFELIKRKINGQDSLGNVIGDILSISQDAVYRRYRGETPLTIFELEKLCQHFNISLDSLFNVNKNKVIFEYQPIDWYHQGLENYLKVMHSALSALKDQKDAQLIFSINNTPIFQLLNFPHLLRFKLFFWAKTHLQLDEYKGRLFKYEKINPDDFKIGQEVHLMYNRIPSKEIYDPELFRGFVREVYYYFDSQQFEDPTYAVYLLGLLERCVLHIQSQAEVGKKYIAETTPPAQGNDLVMYHNETLNGNTTIHYKTELLEGLYFGHNLMNSVHTIDKDYIEDSLIILNKQMANSSVISQTNEKERNRYFGQLIQFIQSFKKKMELELEM